MTGKEWFTEADRRFVDAVQRVMTARTSAHPFHVERECDWSAFREEMARLTLFAEERHAAKHAATREAMLSGGPVTAYRGDGGDQ